MLLPAPGDVREHWLWSDLLSGQSLRVWEILQSSFMKTDKWGNELGEGIL